MADSEAMLTRKTSSVDSSFPVVLPQAPSSEQLDNLEQYVRDMLARERVKRDNTSAEEGLSKMEISSADTASESDNRSKSDGKFIAALQETEPKTPRALETAKLQQQNQQLTENNDVTNVSTKSPLLDLFVELEKTVQPDRLKELLGRAWQADARATLRIIWNARSIHLGKGEHDAFYRCLGWLRQHHPATLLLNLEWLCRSVVEKKVKKKVDDDPDAMEVIEKSDLDAALGELEGPDVLYGASHGYWKDLLNLLVLDVEGQLKVDGNVRGVLHRPNEHGPVRKKRKRNRGKLGGARKSSKSAGEAAKQEQVGNESEKPSNDQDKPVNDQDKPLTDQEESSNDQSKASPEEKKPPVDQKEVARQKRHRLEAQRHEIALERLKDPRYQALHFCVAKLFAKRLEKDRALLNYEDRKARKQISLAAKWAPSLEGFHDKYTFIATSIAELLHPPSGTEAKGEPREQYLKRAREAYRFHHLAPLRKALAVVERDVSAETFGKINYAKVPSIAMNNYKDLFARKDLAHFEKYVERVAAGKAQISGAVLLPGALVAQVRQQREALPWARSQVTARELRDAKVAEIKARVLDGQWKTLVQRIRDSGTLASAIAVCDVSGSMRGPVFPDKTTPMDTSIGLALVLAEVTARPFGSHFITFSGKPAMQSINLADGFAAKVRNLESSEWGFNTDFVAVFERLILPAAVGRKLRQEDMVKTVFVFSDMQFDAAEKGADRWKTSFERIRTKYAEAGYELPHLVFWNLAGGRQMYGGLPGEVQPAPKPVTMDDVGCTLVSGYSQAMLKMFLDEGSFGDGEDEGLEEVQVGEDGTVDTKPVKKTKDPMDGLWRAIGHASYDMLRVYD